MSDSWNVENMSVDDLKEIHSDSTLDALLNTFSDRKSGTEEEEMVNDILDEALEKATDYLETYLDLDPFWIDIRFCPHELGDEPSRARKRRRRWKK